MISRLKSLELQGYKTFANRTVFEFPGAVTAIVGPNGSGKSNITDALRWVLGEQSYSLLRGKKTEDMIFAGSERRTRSGMATVTVILDNSDEWLPIDYSEVAVSRRAYRDGSNEYLLNGQRVRLRDVSELLAKSGLAERTYTIIGQGLVDAALALRAEDRRRLFEEAAGIGLHRSRREEAIRRLENTHRNLERVTDILAELRPRLKSLEKQARRVEDHDQAITNLRSTLKEWYGFHWHQAQLALSDAQSSLQVQEEALAGIRQKSAGFEGEMGGLRAERQALRLELTEQRKISADLRSDLENSNRQVAILNERIDNLLTQESRLRSEIIRAEEELDLLQANHKFAGNEVERKNKELREARVSFEGAEGIRDQRLEARAALERELAVAREVLIKTRAQSSELNTLLVERNAQLAQIDKNSSALSADVEDLKHNLELKQSEETNLLQRRESITKKIDDLESEFTETTQKSAELNDADEKISRKLAAKKAEFEKLNTELDVLEQAERSYAGYSEGAKILLEAVPSDGIKKYQGILAGRIEIPEEFEAAIGAALGDYLEAVILKDSNEIEDALSLLEGLSKKAALIPLDVKVPAEKNPDMQDSDGLIGEALEFVTTSNELLPVLKVLLKNTFLVKNRSSAMRILEEYQNKGGDPNHLDLRAVTLTGEVFHMSGPITTSAGSKPLSLSRPRKQKELKNKLTELEDEIRQEMDQKEDINRSISIVNNQAQEIRDRITRQNESLEAENKSLNQCRIELERLANELDWQVEKLSGLTSEREAIHDQIESLKTRSSTVAHEIFQVESEINTCSDKLSQLPIEGLEGDLAHWITRVAVLEQSVSEAEVRREERKAGLDKARENLNSLHSEVDKLEVDRESLREKVSQIENEIEGKTAKINSINQLIIPAEQKLDRIDQKIADLISDESHHRQISSQSEQNYTQAKINQVRKKEALDTLRKQIEVDFGLVSYEYLEDVSGPNPLPFAELVEELPMVHELSDETERELNKQRSYLHSIGPVNPEVQTEYREVKKRFEYLTSQVQDLQAAITDINQVIQELDEIMKREFCNTFEAVAQEFHQIFSRLFGGGSARLVLTDPDELTDTGIDIEARLPGRREQGLSLLSGGERSLTAVALVFALLRVSPTPFCVLDEVDAMLDEANVGRFRELLRELSETTQFIMITHNRATVQVADIIYGVTMGKDSTSQILSLKVEEIEQVV